MVKLLAAFMVAACFTAVCNAETTSGRTTFYSGQKLKLALDEREKWMADLKANEIEAATSGGYVIGVADALSGIRFCPPDRLSQGQVIAVVHKWLKEHPEFWNVTASDLVGEALGDSFPCRKSKK
jgi:hypothetical protein